MKLVRHSARRAAAIFFRAGVVLMPKANAFPFESGALSLDLSEFLSHVGDDEVLLNDPRRCVERAIADGVDARLDVWMGMPAVIGANALKPFPVSPTARRQRLNPKPAGSIGFAVRRVHDGSTIAVWSLEKNYASVLLSRTGRRLKPVDSRVAQLLITWTSCAPTRW